MKTYKEQLEDIWSEARKVIINKVNNIGTDSNLFNFKTIKVDEERAFNLDDGDYVKELSADHIVSNNNQIYNYGCLSYENLADLADWVKTLY